MSNKATGRLRDELVQVLSQKRMHTNESLGKQGADADAILASPVIRRIQAQSEAKALRAFADAVRFPSEWVLFRRNDESGVTVGDLLRETAERIEKEAN